MLAVDRLRIEVKMMNNLVISDELKYMNSEPLRKDIIKALREGICEITFTKINGERRVMPCTLKAELLPKHNQKDQTIETLKESKTDAISVWCTDAYAWRSFKLSNFISINPLYDNRTENLDSDT